MEAGLDVGPDGSSTFCRFDAFGEQFEGHLDRVTRLAAAALDVPLVAVTLHQRHDHDPLWTHGEKAQFHIDRKYAFATRVVEQRKPLVVADARGDGRHAGHPLVERNDLLFFYAGVPLVMPSGAIIGALGVHDRRFRRMPARQMDMLADFAALVVLEIEACRKSWF